MCHLKSLGSFIFILCSALASIAQGHLSLQHFTEEVGLSYRWVFDITQDQRGFLWFATYDGLNRYDGHSFVTYKHSNSNARSISDSKVAHVTEDHQGNIWMYGQDQIFNRIDLHSGNITQIQTYYKQKAPQTGPLPNMRHFASLSNGDFIVLFQDKDLRNCSFWKYLPAKNAFDHLIDVPTAPAMVNYFSERHDGQLWLWGMGIGYYLIDLPTRTIQYYPVDHMEIKTSLGVQIPIDRHGDFWYPSDPSPEPLEKEEAAIKKFRMPPGMDVRQIGSIRHDNHGHIWINYGEDQLYHYDPQSEKLEWFTDPVFGKTMGANAMNRIFTDQEGAHWIGHFYGALRFANRPTLFHTYLNQSLLAEDEGTRLMSAREMLELTPDAVLVKEEKHDLYIIDINTQKAVPFERRPKSPSDKATTKGIQSMVMSQDGHLWICQSGKLLKTNIVTGVYESFDGPDLVANDRPNLVEDASQNLWWCSMNGLFIFDRFAEKMVPVQVNHPVASVHGHFDYAAYNPEEDAIYGLYDKGVYVVDCKRKSSSLVKIFSDEETDFLTTAILKWNTEFWLSTEMGLIRYHPETKKRTIYGRKDGFPSDIIYSTLAGRHDLWLATHNGLCQFNPSTGQKSTYYREQGLPHNEFNRWSYLKATDGHLFFGGLNGVIRFDPNAFEIPDTKSGHLHVIEFSKYDQKEDSLITLQYDAIEKTEELIIGPHERNITFAYVLTMFTDVKKNQYFHYMEGLENKWIKDGNQNEVRYAQIPPGTYTFRVKATDPHAIAALNEIAIPIVVKQYWYLKWWAIAAYMSFLAAAIGTFYRFQLHQKLNKQETDRIRELDQFKTKMYTNITHEFRTPLTVMLGMNEAVKHYAHEGEVGKLMHANEMIDRNGKNLLNLINQMLDLARLESGSLTAHPLQEDIVPFLKYRLEPFETYAAEKDIQIHFRSEEDEIFMDFDGDILSQILSNLIFNAIKFTPSKGKIDVHVRKTDQDARTSFLKLNVRDTGIGIEAHKIEKIFDRFYQAGDTHAEKGEGTGIGLALVQELVKLLNGTISVRSKIDEGTEFSILLPIRHLAPLAHAKRPITPALQSLHVSALTEEGDGFLYEDEAAPLVLIVEDHPDVYHYIRISLQHHYRTVMAHDGREGIEKAIELIPDVIISDVMMPVKDGFELCSVVKKDERTSHIPVILLTAKSDEESKIEGLEHGADAYLTKPFNRKELLIRLKNLLTLRAELQKHYAGKDTTATISRPPDKEDAFLVKIRSRILDHIDEEDFDIVQLCKTIHLSRAQLHRKLIALTGQSASQLIRSVRLEKARELLSSGQNNVSEVAYQVGFKTQAHFSRVFTETFGISPSEYRKK